MEGVTNVVYRGAAIRLRSLICFRRNVAPIRIFRPNVAVANCRLDEMSPRYRRIVIQANCV